MLDCGRLTFAVPNVITFLLCRLELSKAFTTLVFSVLWSPSSKLLCIRVVHCVNLLFIIINIPLNRNPNRAYLISYFYAKIILSQPFLCY
jgi:hypothetical protein